MPRRSRPPTAAPGLPPFARIVDAHGAALLRFCTAQVGPDRAEDCFQETMLAALRAYAELRDAAAVRAWLFAIAARKTIDAHRSTARAPQPVADVEALATTEHAWRDEALWARVARLPDKQRCAVTLRYCGDLSHREIAVVMDTSEAAARQNVFAGLARLKEEIVPEPGEAHESPARDDQRTWQAKTNRTARQSKRS